MAQKKFNNPFFGRIDDETFKGGTYIDENYSDVVEIEKVKKTGEGDEDFVIIKELKPVNIVKRQDYINQFAGDVGILNILKKVAKTGDVSALAALRDDGTPGIDTTVFPSTYMEAVEMQEKANSMYEKLPEEIKNKFSKDDLIKVSNEAILNYLKTLEKVNDPAVKEEEKNNG